MQEVKPSVLVSINAEESYDVIIIGRGPVVSMLPNTPPKERRKNHRP
jgi:hypothetical protein